MATQTVLAGIEDAMATALRMNCSIKSLVEQLDDTICASDDGNAYGLLCALHLCIDHLDEKLRPAQEQLRSMVLAEEAAA